MNIILTVYVIACCALFGGSLAIATLFAAALKLNEWLKGESMNTER